MYYNQDYTKFTIGTYNKIHCYELPTKNRIYVDNNYYVYIYYMYKLVYKHKRKLYRYNKQVCITIILSTYRDCKV